ncbi:glycosyltransferase [Micromonospora matsumotoense]|uniref:glycosyltransferase n=1 Tax=Micromonospora matsumotoense TaxID=121616 RepID=UPI0033F995A0
MKLALLGPVAWRTPPHHYGPWEQVTGLLAEGLTARGVDVTLFATLDSVTSATLDGVCPRGYADDPSMDGRVWEAMHVSHAFARAAEFDLVHSHLDWLPLTFAEHCRPPLLTTVHGFSGAGILPAYARARSSYVSISDADRAAGLDYVATVHHGVDLTMLPFSPQAGPGLVAFGPHPGAGAHRPDLQTRRRGDRPAAAVRPAPLR